MGQSSRSRLDGGIGCDRASTKTPLTTGRTLVAGPDPRCRARPSLPGRTLVAEPDPHCRVGPALPSQILVAGPDRKSTRKARCLEQRAFLLDQAIGTRSRSLVADGHERTERPTTSAIERHLMIFVTRPEPTVRPPSRMAKPRPSSMAIGWMSSTVISVLSPGMTISVPSGSVMTPVTSVVRK